MHHHRAVAVGPGLAGGVAVTRWAGSVRAECGPGGSRPGVLLFSDLGDRRSGFSGHLTISLSAPKLSDLETQRLSLRAASAALGGASTTTPRDFTVDGKRKSSNFRSGKNNLDFC